jgi:hypothetical protein
MCTSNSQWTKCPYQTFFEEEAQKREKREKQDTEQRDQSQPSLLDNSPQCRSFEYFQESNSNSRVSFSSLSSASSIQSSHLFQIAKTPVLSRDTSTSMFAKSESSPTYHNQHNEEVVLFDEPDEFQVEYDAKNRPKLRVLTKFAGGF